MNFGSRCCKRPTSRSTAALFGTPHPLPPCSPHPTLTLPTPQGRTRGDRQCQRSLPANHRSAARQHKWVSHRAQHTSCALDRQGPLPSSDAEASTDTAPRPAVWASTALSSGRVVVRGADVTGGKRGAAGRAGASRGRQRIGWARTSGLCARSESPVTYLSESPRVPRRRYLEVYCCVRYLYIALLFGALGQQLTALFLVGLCC